MRCFTPEPVKAVAAWNDGTTPGVVLAADDQVFESSDDGASWMPAAGISGTDVRRFAFSPNFAFDRTVFAATVSHRVLRSKDGGLTWSRASLGLPPDQMSDILFSLRYASDRTAYAATAGDGIYVTSDGGDTWTALPAQPAKTIVNALSWVAGRSFDRRYRKRCLSARPERLEHALTRLGSLCD